LPIGVEKDHDLLRGTQMATAGWYPDPDGRLTMRWWEGNRWTAAYTTERTLLEAHSRRKPILIAVGALVLVAVVGFGVLVAVGHRNVAQRRLTAGDRGVPSADGVNSLWAA